MSKNALIKSFVDYVNEHQQIPHDKEDKKDMLRLMTFNVHLWTDLYHKPNIDRVKKLIIESNSDIVGLQEAVSFKRSATNIYDEYFKDTEYKYYAVCNPRYGINMILSKHPIQSTKVVNLGKTIGHNENRYALYVTIKNINIVLTHLDVYDESEITRLNQIKTILDYNRNYDNIILMGDLNSLKQDDYTNTRWKAINDSDKKRGLTTQVMVTNLINENGYTDSLGCVDVSVWSMRRVDYIYFSKNYPCKIVNSFTIPTLISDHFPVVCDIILN